MERRIRFGNAGKAIIVICRLMEESRPFEAVPYPDDEWAISVKEEHFGRLKELAGKDR